MYMCTCVHMHICIYVRMYMYVCIYGYMYICIYVYMYICICVYVFMCICVYVYICIFLQMYLGSVSMLQIDSHRTSSRGFRRSRLQWQSQSPSQQWCMLLVAESKYYFFRNLWTAAPVCLAVAVTISTMVSASGG